MHINRFFSITLLVLCFNASLSFIWAQAHHQKIISILADAPASANIGVVVYNPMTATTVFALRDSFPQIPASTTKLFTTAAVLDLLGPDYLLYTGLFHETGKIKGKTLYGDLFIKGYGYPLLTSTDLQQMITELKQKGITKIEGNIVADATYFDDEYSRNDWIEGDEEQIRIPDVCAITLDKNVKYIRKKVGRRKKRRWRTQTVFIANVPQHVADQTKSLLKKAGITVTGKAKTGEMPENTVCITKRGSKLVQVASQVNKRSDNFLAENLFKVLGAEFSNDQGTSFAAGQAVHTFMDENDIDYSGTKVVDGSGLSRSNQVSVRAIANLLSCIYLDEKKFNVFASTLSIAGEDGTLRGRMIGTAAEGKFRGKTGTLRGSSSVAGYLTCKSGEELIVAIICEYRENGARFYKNIQDDIIVYLSENY